MANNSAAGTTRLYAIQDASIKENTDTNGNWSKNEVYGSDTPIIALVEFDLSSFSQGDGVKSATFSPYVRTLKDNAISDFSIYSTSSNTWSQDSVIWSSRPLKEELLDTIQITQTGSYVDFDVTTAVQEAINNGQSKVTFWIEDSESEYQGFEFDSVNDNPSYANEPQLTIVSGVNSAPVISITKSLTTTEDTPTGSIPFSFSDADDDDLSYSFSDPSKGFVVDNYDGTFTYRPAVNQTGNDSFTLSVSDGAVTTVEKIDVYITDVTDAIDVKVISETGNDYTVQIFVNDGFTAKAGELGSLALEFGFNPTQMSVDDTSLNFSTGFTGLSGAMDSTAGSWSLGGYALPSITALNEPILEFTATLVADQTAADILVTDVLVDDVPVEDFYQTFDFGLNTITGTVSDRNGTLNSVDLNVTLLDDSGNVLPSDSIPVNNFLNGTFDLQVEARSNILIDGTLPYDNSNKLITPQDALDTLRISLGLETTEGSKTPVDFISADFNRNGIVTPHDALEVLKYALGVGDFDAGWIFVDAAKNHANMTHKNVNFSQGVTIEGVASDTSISLLGILVGDVNQTDNPIIIDVI